MSYLPASSASSASNLSIYYRQWVTMASAGNVVFEVAWGVDRMQYGCKVCEQTLTSPIPSDATAVDYAVQEFMKLHRHESPDSPEGKPAPKEWVPVKAVTADFKPVKKKDWDITEGRRFR